MARNDGIDRTSVRNLAVSDKAVGNTQQHNEREKDSYRNPDIIPQRVAWNVHFKKPAASYTDLFAQLEANGTISTRGLKPDATHYCELIFDVNSAYFDNHGGYEFARQFYADAYKAAIQIVGGEQYILSAVMHADEINRAMTEVLGREVYHYHLHVVYIGKRKVQELRTYDIEKFYDTLAKTPCGQYVHGVKQDLSKKQKIQHLYSRSPRSAALQCHLPALAVGWRLQVGAGQHQPCNCRRPHGHLRPHTGQTPAGTDREDRSKLLLPRPDPGSIPAPAKRKAGGNKNLR